MQPQKVSFAVFLTGSGWPDQHIFADFKVTEGSLQWPYRPDRPASCSAVYTSTDEFRQRQDDRLQKRGLEIK